MLNNNRIGYLHFWCQKVLPLVYDNSLSYLEVLYKVKEKLNEVINFTNDIPEYIDKKIVEAFDEEHLKELISEVFRTIEDAISANNEGTNTHFSSNYPIVGTLVWHDNKLYKTKHPIDAGDTVLPNSNIELVNFGDMFNDFLTEVKTRFTDNDDGDRETSSIDRPVHDLVWLHNELYEVIKPIAEGNAYIYTGTNKNVESTNLDKIYDYLLDLISSEINSRELADNLINGRIDSEISSREAQDTALSGRIDAEVTAREAQDTALNGRINAEVAAREAQDTALYERIEAEASAREAQDTALSQRISAIKDIYHQFFDGKNILIIGDSNSAEGEGIYNWVSVLRETFPSANITNHSFNGATLTGSGTGGQARWYGQEAPTGFDYIIFMLGTNDCYHQAGIDSLFYDNKNLDSFTGSLSYVAEKHVTKNPSAKVFYISPIKNTQMSGESVNRNNYLDVYRTHIWRACCLYSWTFIDAGHCAPNINPLTYPQYIADGVHMTASYAPIFADYIIRKMVSGGDAGIGAFTSSIDLSDVLDLNSFPNSSLYAKYKTDGSSELELTIPNVSIGAGLGMVITTALPQWCSAYGTTQGICRTDDLLQGLQMCQIVNSQIQIFPNITTTTTLHATFNINSPKSLYQLPFIF